MVQLICTQPGEWRFNEVDFPQRKPGFAILKVKRVGICGTDLHAFEGTQPFFSYPRILGHELAAEIVEIEANDLFEIGDWVSVIPYFACGDCFACLQNKSNCCSSLQVFGVHMDGGMSEYIQVPIDSLIKDKFLSLDQLAMLEPLAIGAHGVKRGLVKSDDHVLIVGAGPIGLSALLMATLIGANVILMDVNEQRLNFAVEKLGVKQVINALESDPQKRLMDLTMGQMPRVVIDATGSQKAIENSFQWIAHSGIYVLIGLQLKDISFSHPEFHKREATLMSSRNATREDFNWVIESIKNGRLDLNPLLTHHLDFSTVPNEFASLNGLNSGVIKAMISFDR